MAALRTPQTGCPWDLAQNFSTIAPYTLEEAYEVADAIARDDLADLKEELGDLLLQVVFHARMAEEQGAFDFGDVVEASPRNSSAAIRMCSATSARRRRRRSRAFGSASRPRRKGESRAERRQATEGALAGVPVTLPALTRALKLQKKPAKSASTGTIRGRCCARSARKPTRSRPRLMAPRDAAEAAAEVGDLLFAAVNLARHLRADPEAVLRQTNRKFERRFAAIERALAAKGKAPQDATLAEMDALWDEAKAEE